MTIIATLWKPESRDPHYHAKLRCTEGGIRISEASYVVSTPERAEAGGKTQCPKCWRDAAGGYLPTRVKQVQVQGREADA